MKSNPRSILLCVVATASIALCGLNSCFAAEKIDKATLAAAKAAVKNILKDPDSVRFMNVSANVLGDICGEYNAKNSYGGYGEPESFMYVKKTKELLNVQFLQLKREFDEMVAKGAKLKDRTDEYWDARKAKMLEQQAVELRIVGCSLVTAP